MLYIVWEERTNSSKQYGYIYFKRAIDFINYLNLTRSLEVDIFSSYLMRNCRKGCVPCD